MGVSSGGEVGGGVSAGVVGVSPTGSISRFAEGTGVGPGGVGRIRAAIKGRPNKVKPVNRRAQANTTIPMVSTCVPVRLAPSGSSRADVGTLDGDLSKAVRCQ